MNFVLLLNTVRYLKPVQIWNRAVRQIRVPRIAIPAKQVGSLRCRQASLPATIGQGGFDGKGFEWLHERRAFEGADRWNPPGAPRLWVYHLHYFRYLHGLEVPTALYLIQDWIERNPPPSGPGWEPYPLSLRIREWIEWLQSRDGLEATVRERIETSLAEQTSALASRLEYHLLGNHLLENAITLCWAGLSLTGPLAESWVKRGGSLLAEQISAQLLPDGTHEERSPMYQALLAEALLRLAEVAERSSAPKGAQIGSLARSSGLAMLAALEKLSHPDGGAALLNDCSLSETPTAAALRKRFGGGDGEAAGVGMWSLPAAGYLGWRKGGDYLVFDAGPIGPDHQPGHGHADTLGFELSHRGRRLLTDTGTYTYEPGLQRSYDRSTAAHNTLQLDGRDHAELWGAFRCGRRPKVREAGSENGNGGSVFHGAYAATAGLFSRMVHCRRLSFEGEVIRVRDEVKAAGRHTAKLTLHIAPGITVAKEKDVFHLTEGGRMLARVAGDGFAWSEGRSPYHPEFGLEIERPYLSASLAFKDRLTVEWQLRLS